MDCVDLATPFLELNLVFMLHAYCIHITHVCACYMNVTYIFLTYYVHATLCMVLPLTWMLCIFHVCYLHVSFMMHVTCMCFMLMHFTCKFHAFSCLMHLHVLHAFFKNVVWLDVRLSSIL